MRLTIFGNLASGVAYIGLLAVTVAAALMFTSATWIVSRITQICSQLEKPYRRRREGSEDEFSWDVTAECLPRFAPTPILARLEGLSSKCHEMLGQANSWRDKYQSLLNPPKPDAKEAPNERWLPAVTLLASYMTIYRWAVSGVLISTIASAAIVYFFPVTDSDALLLVNLAMMLGIGLHSAFMTVRFETNPILSRLLCNQAKEASLSTSLFGFIAFPFAALAVGVAIAQIPGVLNWGDGIFDLVLKLTTPSALR